MHRGGDELREIRPHEFAALDRDAELGADHRLRGRGAEADDGAWLDGADLREEPRHAGADFDCIRFLVNPPLAARLPLEVLDHVRDVDVGAIDARLDERLVEQRAGGANERPAGEVLFVARLLADEHHLRRLLSLAEDGLRPDPPEITPLAIGGLESQLVDRRPGHDVGENATDEPTQVKSLLKSTPSIFPRDRRTRFCARIGVASPSGRRNIIRISTLTPPPSAA
jgi:hypothetical protein